ncbi:MAG TPA: DUF1573 domain-containing protein [candidate division Zixibacteria bacterium]|nr:DUF1573 domain-containing protein [candidate division Zixibacteria bacterium]
MKRTHIISLAAVTALAVTAAAGPQVRMGETEFSFGQMPPSAIVTHTFWVYSVGDEPIEIDTVITACGCTSIPLEKRIVPPGDSVGLEMWFSSKSFRGQVAKRPSFRIKGDSAEYSFKFYTTVVHDPKELFPIAVFPPVFNFSQSTPEERFENKFGLQNRADEDITIRIADHNPAILDITAPDTLRAGEIWEGWVSLKPDSRGASFVTSVTFEVNNSAMHRLTVPIVGKPPETKADSLKFDFAKPSPLDK